MSNHADKLAQVFKADARTSDLSSGGLLLDDIAGDFMIKPFKRSKLLSEVRIEPLDAPDKRLPKMIPPSQVAHPGAEGVALPVADRAKVTHDQVLLETKEIKAEIRFSYGYLEDNIRAGTIKDVIINEVAIPVFRSNLEFGAVQGDTTSANDILQLQDGWLKRFTANVVSHSSAAPSKAMFSTAIREMDSEFIEDMGGMRHYMGKHAVIRYMELVADRQTDLGDAYFTGMATVTGAGIPIVAVPRFPENLGAGTNLTTCLTTRPDNLIYGFWKQVSIRMGSDISAGVDIVVVRCRAGNNIEWDEAGTKTTDVLNLN